MVSPPSKWRRRRRERKQKRGCRSGSDARLRKQPHRPALPSLFLSNARSITHKMDELELQIATTSFVRNCSIIFITETWLHPLIPDAAVALAGRMLHRQDRNRDSGYQAFKRARGQGSSKTDGESDDGEPGKEKECVVENGGFQFDENFNTEGTYKNIQM